MNPLLESREFETAERGEEVEAKERVTLDFYPNDYRFSDEFMVLPVLSEDLIIGTTTMQKWRFKLDFEHEELGIKGVKNGSADAIQASENLYKAAED